MCGTSDPWRGSHVDEAEPDHGRAHLGSLGDGRLRGRRRGREADGLEVDIEPDDHLTDEQSDTDDRPEGAARRRGVPGVHKGLNNALRKPRGLGETFAPNADYRKYSFDPAQSSLSAVVQQFSSQGLKMTGDPGKPRIVLQSLELEAKPYPLVTLSDCPTPPVQWHPADTKTGKDVSAPLPSRVAAPPHKVTVQVIYYQGRWGVSRTTSELSLTCSA